MHLYDQTSKAEIVVYQTRVGQTTAFDHYDFDGDAQTGIARMINGGSVGGAD